MRQDDDEDPEIDELEPIDSLDDEDDLDGLEEIEEETERPARSGTMTFISGILLGALVGAGIALLVAPERGSVIRKRLKKFAKKVRAKAEEKMGDLADGAGRELARRRRKLRQQLRERV